ncbi:MAG: hypothetical protein ABF743_13360 [Schleiferilactobacillus perolens]|uniref:hypothetical protein n=1 Tax=Schleiferilactobacillus perolens TaxID=100468 RepID=UPI0039E748F1
MKKISAVIVAAASSILFLGTIVSIQETVSNPEFSITVVQAAVTSKDTTQSVTKSQSLTSQSQLASSSETDATNYFLPWDTVDNYEIQFATGAGNLQDSYYSHVLGYVHLYKVVYVGNAQYMGFYH